MDICAWYGTEAWQQERGAISGQVSQVQHKERSERRVNEGREAMRKCWSVFSTAVLIVLILLLAAFGGVRLAGLTPYMVTSGSMEPEYPVGSLIYVKDVPPEEIVEGDVITFRLTDGRTVATHQVYEVDREQEQFRTQGINNRDSEGNILHDAEPGYYEIGIEEDGRLTAKAGDDEYSVVYEPGTLTVRYVTDPAGVLAGSADIATPVTVEAQAETAAAVSRSGADAQADKAFGVVSADTVFQTNGKTGIAGLTEDDGTGQISLMCDDILSLGTDVQNRVEQMTGRAEAFLTEGGYSLEERQYEYKYLDLINEHDGNAWVSSSEGVDVYYPYPEGTSYETAEDTAFTVLHFKDLHREYGFESGETIEQLIDACEVEAVAVEATPQGLKFHVPESGFSPFAVTWQPKELYTGPAGGAGDGGAGGDGGAQETGQDAARTGDEAHLILWAVIAVLALAVLGAGGYIRHTHKRK